MPRLPPLPASRRVSFHSRPQHRDTAHVIAVFFQVYRHVAEAAAPTPARLPSSFLLRLMIEGLQFSFATPRRLSRASFLFEFAAHA